MLIATLGLMAMIAFVFLPIILKGMDSRANANPVVVDTDQFGSLRQRELMSLSRRRLTVLRFLQGVQQAVVEEVAAAGGDINEINQAALAVRRAEMIIGDASQQSVVDSWLLARSAEQLGLVVSDRAVNDFLGEISADRVPADQFRAIFKQLGFGTEYLFPLLREELLALRLQELFHVSLAGTTPAQRWGYFARLKRMATVEALPVPVADLVDQVPEPDEATLKEFFEAHQDTYAQPFSPEPGFRKPHRIAVRYFKAGYDKFMSSDKVTEEQILKEYEEQKEFYDGWEQQSAVQPPAEEAAVEETPPEEEAVDPTSEATGTEEEEKSPQQPTTKEGDASEAPAAEPNDSGASGSTSTKSPFMLASYLPEQPAEQDASEPSGTDEPSETGQAAETSEADDAASEPDSQEPAADIETPAAAPEPSADEPEAPAPETAEPIAGPELPVAEPSVQPADVPEEPAAEPPQDTRPKVSELPPGDVSPAGLERGPSDRVKELIRIQLTNQKTQEAIEQIQKKFGRIQEGVEQYRKQWIRYEVALLQDDKEAAPPEELDVEGLAGEYGLVTQRTALMSNFDAASTEIGQTVVDETIPFARYAFQDSWKPYLTATSRNNAGDRYLFWKVEETKSRVPQWEDEGVRQQVEKAWKMMQARGLATEKAEQLADEARKSGKSLKDAFDAETGDRVVVTSPFSWMTRGNVPMMTSPAPPPRLSEIEGVEMPGPDFMRTVFGLQPGEIAVAMNHPQRIAYVVRVTEMNPSDTVLWELFKVDRYETYADVARISQARLRQSWREELRSAAGLKWERKADDQPDEQ